MKVDPKAIAAILLGIERKDDKTLPGWKRMEQPLKVTTPNSLEDDDSSASSDVSPTGGLGEVFSSFLVKLILQVMGGAGAVWGFSEACGFRTAENDWFWRPFALGFGVFFFLRWLLQLRRALAARWEARVVTVAAITVPTAPATPMSPLLSPQCMRRSYSSTCLPEVELRVSKTFDFEDVDSDEEEDEQEWPEQEWPVRLFLSSSENSSSCESDGDLARVSPKLQDPCPQHDDDHEETPQSKLLVVATAFPKKHDEGPARIPTPRQLPEHQLPLNAKAA